MKKDRQKSIAEKLADIESQILRLNFEKEFLLKGRKLEDIVFNSKNMDIILKYFDVLDNGNFCLKNRDDYELRVPEFWVNTGENSKHPENEKISYGSLQLKHENYFDFTKMILEFKKMYELEIADLYDEVKQIKKIIKICNKIAQEISDREG